MLKKSGLGGVAAAALLLGVVGAVAQSPRDSGAGNTQPSGGGASSAQGTGGSLGAGTSAQTGQSRSGAGANTQPAGGGASSAQGAGGSLGESGRASQGAASTQTGSAASGGGAVTLSSEEQTKLKSSMHNISVKQVNISVEPRTGIILPETVNAELEPIPSQIVEVVPRFRGYKVIRVKNEILVVEPSTRRVVYIIQS